MQWRGSFSKYQTKRLLRRFSIMQFVSLATNQAGMALARRGRQPHHLLRFQRTFHYRLVASTYLTRCAPITSPLFPSLALFVALLIKAMGSKRRMPWWWRRTTRPADP